MIVNRIYEVLPFLLFFNNGRKNNFRNMTIFTSYPMYFDPLRTMVGLKNRIYLIKYMFFPKNVSKPPDFAKVRDFDGFGGKICI